VQLSDPALTNALKKLEPLPGFAAQSHLSPHRPGERPEVRVAPVDARLAAVLVALYPLAGGEAVFALIKRQPDDTVHSAQISLPGGRIEDHDSSIEDAALREAQEEIHIQAENVRILGRLSSLYIPPSKHLVHPVIGILENRPPLRPNPREVAAILEIPLEALLAPIHSEKRTDWIVPYFLMGGEKVWGATAMILSELRTILARYFSAAG